MSMTDEIAKRLDRRIYRKRARRDGLRCVICGREIRKGDNYILFKPKYAPDRIYCEECRGPDDQVRAMYAFQEYDIDSRVWSPLKRWAIRRLYKRF